ncbi:asparagine synthase (glutamine-hydrolyzing) [Streptomyces sp. MK5]|uniref:asparagine synthase (glutamine-hydrolyzing) n=1 Tax=Streptomyces sp. MK5 TaxID=3064253 RepID=UPI002741B36C|nr:asparagine synthase (glutamine-hydrolyzing) [Streptomyces sp. MK5]
MCGIVGLISFDDDLTRRPELLTAMRGALALRGPDAVGEWVSPRALLVPRRLAVVDLEGGRQPMVATDATGADTVVLSYTGEVFNADGLRAELRRRGHGFRERSDTEVVLRAYEEWGPSCAERLRGMFAFAVWDVRREELVLIRDRFGIYPLYYADTATGLAFGSEPKALFTTGAIEPVVDGAGLLEALSFTPTPGHAPFRGMREVIPGEVVRFGRDGLRRHRYWNFTPARHRDDLAATEHRVRELLEDVVRQQVAADVPISSMLSGGLDSSAVCALAGRVLAGGGRAEPLKTFSMEFSYHLDHFRPDEVHDSPDSPYVAKTAAHLGTEHRELLIDREHLADRDGQAEVVRAMERPVAGLDMYVSLYRLSQEVRRFSTVTLTGDGSDELFGGYVWFHDPYYVRAKTFPWLGASHQMEFLSGLLRRDLHRRLDFPGHERESYRAALAEVPLTGDETPHERRMREITYLNMTRYLRVILDRKDRLGMAASVEGRVPFCDHLLAEYVYNVPWEMKVADGREKSLLRAAVRDLLPEEVLARRKSPFPTAQDPAYRTALREQLRAVVADPANPVNELLEPARVKSVLEDPSCGLRAGVTRMSIEAAVQLHHWLASGVTVSL